MALRKRIEDLGRISERLNTLLDHHIFDYSEGNLNADAMGDEEVMARAISQIEDELCEIWHIARFGDDEDENESIFPEENN